MLSIKLFHFFFSLFRYNQNIETLKLFRLSSVCLGSNETPKLSVSVRKQNKQNKSFVPDSAETSFGSSFGCFKSKLVLKDTLSVIV